MILTDYILNTLKISLLKLFKKLNCLRLNEHIYWVFITYKITLTHMELLIYVLHLLKLYLSELNKLNELSPILSLFGLVRFKSSKVLALLRPELENVDSIKLRSKLSKLSQADSVCFAKFDCGELFKMRWLSLLKRISGSVSGNLGVVDRGFEGFKSDDRL